MKKPPLKTWLGNAALLILGTTIAVLLAEVATRIFYPIYDGRQNVTEDGEPIQSWTPPGTVYFQVGAEYHARTTITPEGHRAPAVDGQPDVIFLGDSNTFGWGLSDEETFISLYCSEAGLSCANLAMPSTGTAQQMDRLEQYLQGLGWRPKRVVLMLYGMTTAFGAGNDLADNYDYVRWSDHRPGDRLGAGQMEESESAGPEAVEVEGAMQGEADVAESIRAEHDAAESVQGGHEAEPLAAEEEPDVGFVEGLLGHRQALLARSNLVRIVKFHWGPLIKSLLVPGLDETRRAEALELTRAELERFVEISEEYDFEPVVYVLHAIQDLMRGTHPETVSDLTAISPLPLRSTAEAFLEDPAGFFYPYDGHPNPRGGRRIADFLLETAEPLVRNEPSG